MDHNNDYPEVRLRRVQARIRAAEQAAGRPAGSVQLLAVSKRHSAEAIRSLADQGQHSFGESYLQEAQEKMAHLAGRSIEWHFIGPIQSNKTRPIAEHFHWAHSVDRLKIAKRLSEQRPVDMPPLNICLQVNVSGEQTKSGMALEELPATAEKVRGLPGLRLRGLMTIPAPESDPERQRLPFRRLREALDALNRTGFALDTLSMGMSDDLEAAIFEGATVVRVGSALFGPRD